MDINHLNFNAELVSILQAVASSRFVSLDLELSGIPSRQKQFRASGGGNGKPTLQERYAETKAAAEEYQVLQLGLTCVEENLECGCYILRPFNFNLQPIPDPALHIERDVTLQSGALGFLRQQGFDIGEPFYTGVPYLSREEEVKSRAIEKVKREKSSRDIITLRPDDRVAHDFLHSVRQKVLDHFYRTTNYEESDYLVIAPAGFDTPGYNGRGLNKFQKKLVHQLLQTEHPGLLSLSKGDVIHIIVLDEERDRSQRQKQEHYFETKLRSQVGLRFVAEALCPNIGLGLNSRLQSPEVQNLGSAVEWALQPTEMAEDIEARQEQHTLLIKPLRQKKRMLVGHNLFLDLIYFYKCFFGPLPTDVRDFASIVRTTFPTIFDTKFLADDLNQNSPAYKSSLEDLFQEMESSDAPMPIIEVPGTFGKYATKKPAHEAGYDSYLTAVALIKMSARTDGSNKIIVNSAIPPADTPAADQRSRFSSEDSPSDSDGDGSESGGIRLDPESHDHLSRKGSGQNRFEALANAGFPDEPESPSSESQSAIRTMIPDANSPFWSRYGNKLRVNGTQEGTCFLSPLEGNLFQTGNGG